MLICFLVMSFISMLLSVYLTVPILSTYQSLDDHLRKKGIYF